MSPVPQSNTVAFDSKRHPKSVSLTFKVALLYVALLPWESAFEIFFNFDTMFKPYRIVGIVLIVIVFYGVALGRFRIQLDYWDRLLVSVLGLGTVLAVFWTQLRGMDFAPTFVEGYLIVAAYLPALCLRWLPELRIMSHLNLMLKVFSWSVLLSCLVSMWLGNSETRFSGFFHNPNWLGLAVTWVGLFYLSFTLFGHWRSLRVILRGGAIVLFCTWATLASGSRGALIAFCLAALLILLSAFSVEKLSTLLVVTCTMAVLGAVLWAPFSSMFESEVAGTKRRFSGEELEMAGGRRDIWAAALDVTADSFWVGVGIGQYINYHQKYVDRRIRIYKEKIDEKTLGTHSEYVNILSGAGMIGLIAYFSWFAWHCYFLSRAALMHSGHYALSFIAASTLLLSIFQASANCLIAPLFHFAMSIILVVKALGQTPNRPLRAASDLPKAAV